ncbi:Protein STB6 [Penicillium rolfsii]|nr:Protein STB6 [Penicillium rolfsii]
MQSGAPPAPLVGYRDSAKAPDSIRANPASNANGLEPRPKLQGHQKIIFTDPVALRYLEEDPSTDVLHRRETLQGYEIYIVEQWACSRQHPTFAISTYTGDPSHTVVVDVLSVPTDESTWSPRLRMYFDAVEQSSARRRETSFGTIMVTDLETFPSALTIIPVPGGDIRKHRYDFIVNEDLKRLGCAGRAGLKLEYPSAATEAKFHQLYRTSDRVPLYSAVTELVKQCQIALMVFDKLAPEYVDGLLCDVTEKAISDWWADIGTDLYNIEPSDGILGPTSVAALLGTLLGARNRLHAYGAPVGKDAFDIDNLKRGISGFQKSQKMNRSRRLDRRTLDKLHRATAKAANAEGWTDAIKSTMTELSGQGGEMVMGMVRGREKGGIADIETLDLDNFVQCVYGSRAKWLWLGKTRKSGLDTTFAPGPGTDMMFTADDQGGYVWTSRKKHSTEELHAERVASGLDRQWKTPDSLVAEEKDQRRKRVSGKVSDARAGLGRFKDAVGLPSLRSHHHKNSREGVALTHDIAYQPQIDSDTDLPTHKPKAGPGRSETTVDEEFVTQPEDEQNVQSSTTAKPSTETKTPEIHVEAVPSTEDTEEQSERADQLSDLQRIPTIDEESDLERIRSRSPAASSDPGQDRDDSSTNLALMALRRPQSCEELRALDNEDQRRDDSCPRHLSFSNVEEVVLTWEPLGTQPTIKDTTILEEAIVQEDMLASDARIFSTRILDLSEHTVPWVERQVESVDGLNNILYERHEELNAVYLERFNDYQRLRERSSDLVTDEQSYLSDSVKRVELLGAKLDYELHVLESKVEDMEEGLGDFERHIDNVETRVKGLLQGEEEHGVSWMTWLRRSIGFTAQ